MDGKFRGFDFPLERGEERGTMTGRAVRSRRQQLQPASKRGCLTDRTARPYDQCRSLLGKNRRRQIRRIFLEERKQHITSHRGSQVSHHHALLSSRASSPWLGRHSSHDVSRLLSRSASAGTHASSVARHGKARHHCRTFLPCFELTADRLTAATSLSPGPRAYWRAVALILACLLGPSNILVPNCLARSLACLACFLCLLVQINSAKLCSRVVVEVVESSPDCSTRIMSTGRKRQRNCHPHTRPPAACSMPWWPSSVAIMNDDDDDRDGSAEHRGAKLRRGGAR